MGTEESKLRKLAKELGYKVTKKRKKKFASMLTMELIFLHGKLSLPHFTKGMSFRQIKMRMIKHPRFNKILDNNFKGAAKRAKFDDPTQKRWSTLTAIQDINSNGEYARYKLVERHIGKYLNKKIMKVIYNLENYQEWANKAKHKDYKKLSSRN